MHHIYHTQGFVLGSRNFGEANKYLTIFTRELGVVKAAAQVIRHLKSKLRFSLQDYSLAKIDLVRGRDIWRVTSATLLPQFETVRKSPELYHIYLRMLSLLRRLYKGEIAHPELFDDLAEAFAFLDTTVLLPDRIHDAEAVIALKILSRLGYVGESTEENSLTAEPLSLSLLDIASGRRKSMIAQINRSLRESHL